MPLNPNIALQVKGLEVPNPLAQMAQVTQIQSAMQQQKIAGMQIEQLEQDRREMLELQQKLSQMGANPDLRVVAQTLMRSPKTLQLGTQMLEKLKEQEGYAAFLKRNEPTAAAAPGAAVAPAMPGTAPAAAGVAPAGARINALAPQGAEAPEPVNALLGRGLRSPDAIRREMTELAQFPNIPQAKARMEILKTELAEAVKAPTLHNVPRVGAIDTRTGQLVRAEGPAEMPADVRVAEWLRTATPEQKQAYETAQAAKRQQINIDQRQETALVTALGKEQAEAIAKGREGASSAASNLATINTGRQLLKEGVLTGTGAEFLVNLNQALKTIGIDFGYAEASANAQAFTATMGASVGQLIKQFGAGTGLSNADREYAEKMAGGKITLDEKAIRRILDINERASRNVIQAHNKSVEKAGKAAEWFKVEEPTFEPIDLPSLPATPRSTVPRLRGSTPSAAPAQTPAPATAPAAGGVKFLGFEER